MRAADVDALAACAAAADDGAEPSVATPVDTGEIEPSPTVIAPAADADERRRRKLKQKKKKWKERKKAQREAAAEAELPPCREIETPPAVLAALEAADRASDASAASPTSITAAVAASAASKTALEASDRSSTPEPTVPADPSLFKPGGASSWGRGFLAIGPTVKKAPPDLAAKDKAPPPDLRDPYAYIASTCDDDDDLTAPALHDAPSPHFDGLVIEEVTPEELARLGV
jgi:hypothetical protein